MATNVDKALEPGLLGDGDIEIEIDVEAEDDGVLVDFSDPGKEETPFNANLAEVIEADELLKISSQILEYTLADKRARKEWEKALEKGLDFLGLKIEERTQPWPGASGVFHPMLIEAVIAFQSQSMMELWPASGPVKVQAIGTISEDLEKQSLRVAADMNYITVEKMRDYRPETERLLFNLPLAGSAFRKLYFDPVLKVPRAAFVAAQDFLAPYGATDLHTCDRYTHVMKKTEYEMEKLQKAGFYLDIDIGTPTPKYEEVQQKIDKLVGETPQVEHDDRHTILECHVYYEVPGFHEDEGPLPYVISVHRDSGDVLAVYRNWKEADPDQKKRLWFAHHQYMPGFGFYGIGLIHLLGGLSRSATSIMRQLIDAGTLSNLPAGLKSRGLRIKGDDTPLMPGEFRDVDIPGGAIKDNITFLPYKEPSAVLFALLGNVVEEGRRIGSMADVKASDMSNQAPVGSTLAIIERSMKVMSAVQARLHSSMRDEFRILAELIRDFMPEEYPYEVPPGATRKSDYDDRVDILPVSNPNATTMAQRIMQHQAALQLASTQPEIYDSRRLHKRMLYALGMEDTDEIIPNDEDIPNQDPITENMSIIKGEPVKVYPEQDHEAHIMAHMSAIQDPKIGELLAQSPQKDAIFGAASAHVQAHVAYKYRRDIEKQLGFDLPALDEELPPEVEREISRLTAPAAEKVLGKARAEEEQKRIQEQMQDPMIQLRLEELRIKADDVERRKAADTGRVEQQEADRESKERIEGAKVGAGLAEAALESEQADKDRSSKELLKGAELGVDLAEDAANQLTKQREQKENT